MADRTVSVRLRADVTAYIAAMRAAQRATRQAQEQMQQTGRGGSRQFNETERGAQRLERALHRVMETERQRSREQQQNNQTQEQQRRSVERARDEMGRFTRRVQENTQSQRENTQSQQENNRSTGQARDSRGRFTRSTQENTQSTDENTESTERNRESQERATRATATRGQAIASLVSGAGALVAAELASAAAIGAFALTAVPAIAKVVTAQEDLAANWDSLSPLQRGAAVEVQNLKDGYLALARSFEPEAMGAFNTVLRTGSDLLPILSDLANDTAVDVQRFLDRIGGFASGPEMRAFLDSMGVQAPRALDMLGTTVTTTGSLALRLATDLSPVGVSVLEVANGALGLVNSLAQINPLFAQFAITALLLRAPVTGLIAGVGNLSTRMRTYAAETRGATVATRALGVVSALGPALWVAGAAALFLWASNAGQASSESDKLTDSLQRQHRAVGNNLTGYERLVGDLLPRLQDAERRARQEMDANNEVTAKTGKEVLAYRGKLEQAKTSVWNIKRASEELAHTYGITKDQAIELATATGVDLSEAVDKNGRLTFEASQKINRYKLAVEQANNPTKAISLSLERASNEALSLEDRVNALTAALDAAFNPSLRMYQVTTQLRQGYRDLGEQFSEAKGRMDGNTASSLQLQQAFANQLSSVRDLADATFAKTKSMDEARAAVSEQLPLLYTLAGTNRQAKAQVDALATSLGINTSALNVSKSSFIAQATAMFGSKTRAEELWLAYSKLRGATTAGTGALGSYITQVRTSAEQARIQTLRTDGARGAQTIYNQRVREALPVLYALAGNNKAAKAQVDALARSTGHATGVTRTSRDAFLSAAKSMGISEDRAAALWKELKKIPRRVRTDVDINAEGYWSNWRSMPGATTGGPAHLVPRAKGGPIPSIGPESSRAYDSVPALLRVDEHVWTPEEVDAVGGHDAMYRLRAMARAGQLQGYARGGRVALDRPGSTRAVVDDVMAPINRGYAGFITSIIRVMAAAWKRYAGSGGPVVAAARSQIGVPYVWGGTAWNQGLDCSGLTSQAWQRGAGKWIGRTTYAQYPNSTHIGSPRPAALGFPHMGHVVMASKPGYIIEAPYTGASVREVPISRHYEWRWPNAAKFAEGGQVEREREQVGREFLRTRNPRLIEEAKILHAAGDPGGLGIPGYEGGGWVRGRGGRDTNLIAATRGEFVVSGDAAAKHAGLVEAINSDQIGQALVAPLRSAAPVAVAGGDGASLAGGSGRLVVELHNHGVIGSRLELQDWLARTMTDLKKRGRI